MLHASDGSLPKGKTNLC